MYETKQSWRERIVIMPSVAVEVELDGKWQKPASWCKNPVETPQGMLHKHLQSVDEFRESLADPSEREVYRELTSGDKLTVSYNEHNGDECTVTINSSDASVPKTRNDTHSSTNPESSNEGTETSAEPNEAPFDGDAEFTEFAKGFVPGVDDGARRHKSTITTAHTIYSTSHSS